MGEKVRVSAAWYSNNCKFACVSECKLGHNARHKHGLLAATSNDREWKKCQVARVA